MPLQKIFPRGMAHTHSLPIPLRYAATLAIVFGVFFVRRYVDPWLSEGYPFLLFFVGILISASLFDSGSGYVATAASAILVTCFYLPPIGSPLVDDPRHAVALVFFIGIGTAITFTIEALHKALHAQRRLQRSRALLLREFRHRTRNDLNSLVAILHVRARAARSEAVREGLSEAANHALALARIHTRLSAGEGESEDNPASVSTRDFIVGLCHDIEAAHLGGGLRPIAVIVEAEDHLLLADRAVPLGLVLNEAETNTLKYAFEEDCQGTLRVSFVRESGDYILTIADNGVGLPPEGEASGPPDPPPTGSGLGTRLLRGLASQLRGTFSRGPGPGRRGAVVTLRFPVEAPGM